jgi:hypothetical protein
MSTCLSTPSDLESLDAGVPPGNVLLWKTYYEKEEVPMHPLNLIVGILVGTAVE